MLSVPTERFECGLRNGEWYEWVKWAFVKRGGFGGSATRAWLAPYPAAYSCCSVFFGGMEGWIHGRLARLDDYLLIRRSACGGHLGF